MAHPHEPASGGSEMLGADDTTAPAQSATFLRVLRQAEEDGIEGHALSRLFWLMNAHPRLLGHQRCLQNLMRLTATPEFIDGVHGWAAPWTGDIPAWNTAAQWATELVGKAHTEMTDFVRQPRNERHHILMRHGINRHPLPGALWIRHHSEPDPSAPTVALAAPGRMFRLLQWHFFCSQVEARHSHSTLEQYLQYDLPAEWPAWPRPAAAVGLALRQLSYSHWDSLLADLPYETRLDDFTAALEDGREQLLIRHDDGEARQRIFALASYFGDFNLYFKGLPARSRRQGGGGGSGGGRKPVPGFIHFTASPHILFKPPEPDTGDEDVPSSTVTRAYIHSDSLTPQKVEELEGLGIAPAEDLRPVMDLFPIEDRPGGIHSLWSMRQAVEAAAQRDYWDKTQLTPLEVSVLLETTDVTHQDRIKQSANTITEAARLVLKCMLILGCPQEEARTIRTMLKAEFDATASCDGTTVNRVVLVDGHSGASAGFALPAISPRYASELPANFRQRANATARHIMLPDVAGLGAALLDHQRNAGGEIGDAVFSEAPERIEAEIKSLLEFANRTLDARSRGRLTTVKLARKLPALLSRAGLDEVGVAIICGDSGYEGQSRLHYTQHRTGRLAKAYAKAVRRLLVEAGRPIKTTWQTSEIADGAAVGARLVVRQDELRDFVRAIRAELEQEPALTRSGRRRYHRAFLLYSLVMQGLLTGMRPSNQPGLLLVEVLANGGPMATDDFVASVVEKDDQYEARARPVVIPARLQRQFANVVAHSRATWQWLPADLSMPRTTTAKQMFMDWSDNGATQRAQPVDGKWLAEQLHHFGMPATANFTRAFVRTWLLEDGCPEQVIDAFLGHAGMGQSPTCMHGTFDFDSHLQEIGARLDKMANELGLQPVSSRLATPGVNASTTSATGA